MTLFPAFRKAANIEDTGKYHFVRWMKGGSGSLLVQDSLDRQWVVKPFENFQGQRVLCNEVLGAVFLRAAGLPSLPWRRIRLDPELVAIMRKTDRRFASRSFDTEHFASLFVGHPTYQTSALVCVPENEVWVHQLLGLYVFDIWAAHCDRREVLAVMNALTSQISLIAIDNGHLFFGPGPRMTERAHVRQWLSYAMQSLVVDESSTPILEWWIEHLRFVLPSFIDREVNSSDRPWGCNELIMNPARFHMRLSQLDELVSQDRSWQIEQCKRVKPLLYA